jgi:hypothetical protein
MRAVRKTDYWIALPVDAPIVGGVSGDTFAELSKRSKHANTSSSMPLPRLKSS